MVVAQVPPVLILPQLHQAPAVLVVLYWFVPLATWGLFINLIRALAEHYPGDEFGAGGSGATRSLNSLDPRS